MILKNLIKLIYTTIKGKFFWNYKLYLKYPSDFLNSNSNSSDDIVIVIQGPIMDSFTYETVKYYNKVFNEAVIVLSTWKLDSEIKNKFDKLKVEVLENEFPSKKGPYNINLQIISSSNGIDYSERFNRKYIIKSRTDQRVYDPNTLKYLKNLMKVFPSNYSSRLIGCSLDSILSRKFHLSDHFMFGDIKSMKNYWSPKIDNREIPSYNIEDNNQHEFGLGGSYFFTQYIKNHLGLSINSNYEQILAENFLIVNKNDIGLYWNKYNLKFDKYVSNSIINERDFAFWLNLYNKYNS